MLNREATNINNVIVFGLTRSELKLTIHCSREEHANHYTTTVTANASNLRLLYYDIKVFKSNVVFNIPFFFSSDNSMTDTNPIIVKITRETGLPDFGGQSPIGSKHEDEVLNDDAGSVEEFLAKTKGAFDSMTEILVAIHVIVMKCVFEVRFAIHVIVMKGAFEVQMAIHVVVVKGTFEVLVAIHVIFIVMKGVFEG